MKEEFWDNHNHTQNHVMGFFQTPSKAMGEDKHQYFLT